LKVLFDTNVLLDVLLDREPFANSPISVYTPEELLNLLDSGALSE
jgi:predicted nucleic acid-binding protein